MPAAMAIGLAERHGCPPIDEQRQLRPSSAQVEAWTRAIMELARVHALDDICDGPAMLARLREWLEPKAEPCRRRGPQPVL